MPLRSLRVQTDAKSVQLQEDPVSVKPPRVPYARHSEYPAWILGSVDLTQPLNLYAVAQSLRALFYSRSYHALGRSTVIIQAYITEAAPAANETFVWKLSPRDANDVHTHHTPSAASYKAMLPAKDGDISVRVILCGGTAVQR